MRPHDTSACEMHHSAAMNLAMMRAGATQPRPPYEPTPEPHVPHPFPTPQEPPSPNTPLPYFPEVPGPEPMHPEIPAEPIHPPVAR